MREHDMCEYIHIYYIYAYVCIHLVFRTHQQNNAAYEFICVIHKESSRGVIRYFATLCIYKVPLTPTIPHVVILRSSLPYVLGPALGRHDRCSAAGLSRARVSSYRGPSTKTQG